MAASSGISDAVGGVISAAVSGGAGLLSGWTAGGEAKKARKWQAIRYRRRYQDTVRDLRLAGLNPILAAGSAQVGGMPGSPETADYSKAADFLGSSVEKGLNAAIAIHSARKLKGEADSAEAKGRFDKADVAYKLGDKSVTFRTKEGGIYAPDEDVIPPFEQAQKAAVEATRSSALSNTAEARYKEQLAQVPEAQRRQIENAIKNANITDFEKALLNAGIQVGAGVLGLFTKLVGRRFGR